MNPRPQDHAAHAGLDRILAALGERCGPPAERRIPIYHVDEIAAAARALAAAWEAAAPSALLARLAAHPAGAQLLAASIQLEEDDAPVLRVSAPEAVCRAFDERA